MLFGIQSFIIRNTKGLNNKSNSTREGFIASSILMPAKDEMWGLGNLLSFMLAMKSRQNEEQVQDLYFLIHILLANDIF
ncbi:MAG: hypothetical protein CL912_20980 [Deltaproteobacteria bacterium]|nr:hypothetical protein [Deltaproteobacteria bacterium]